MVQHQRVVLGHGASHKHLAGGWALVSELSDSSWAMLWLPVGGQWRIFLCLTPWLQLGVS